jgi:hypothetical protein
MKNSLVRSLKIVFQLLAVVFLCATELFGLLSPYMKLINIVFVFPLVLIYIFYLNNEYNKNTKLIVLGILFFKVVPIIVAGNLMSGNYYLIGSADSGFVIQIETELFFWKIFLENAKSGMVMFVYLILGFLFAKIAQKLQKSKYAT